MTRWFLSLVGRVSIDRPIAVALKYADTMMQQSIRVCCSVPLGNLRRRPCSLTNGHLESSINSTAIQLQDSLIGLSNVLFSMNLN